MDQATRDEIVTQQLQTPKGKELFAAAIYRGVNHAFGIPDDEGETFIREFQDLFGDHHSLPTYLRYLRETTYKLKPIVH